MVTISVRPTISDYNGDEWETVREGTRDDGVRVRVEAKGYDPIGMDEFFEDRVSIVPTSNRVQGYAESLFDVGEVWNHFYQRVMSDDEAMKATERFYKVFRDDVAVYSYDMSGFSQGEYSQGFIGVGLTEGDSLGIDDPEEFARGTMQEWCDHAYATLAQVRVVEQTHVCDCEHCDAHGWVEVDAWGGIVLDDDDAKNRDYLTMFADGNITWG